MDGDVLIGVYYLTTQHAIVASGVEIPSFLVHSKLVVY